MRRTSSNYICGRRDEGGGTQTRFWLSHQDLTGKAEQRDPLIPSPSSSGRAGIVKEKPTCQVMHKGTQGLHCLTMIQPYHHNACLSPCVAVGMNFGGKISGCNRKKVWKWPEKSVCAHVKGTNTSAPCRVLVKIELAFTTMVSLYLLYTIPFSPLSQTKHHKHT